MEHFSYSFSLMLIHSIWQSALLLLLYYFFNAVFRNNRPLVKRNVLFSFLFTQLLLSLFTFYLYFITYEPAFNNFPIQLLTPALEADPLLLKFAPWLFIIYLLLFLTRCFAVTKNWLKFNQKINWEKVPVEIRLFTRRMCYQFGIKKKIAIGYCNKINTPVTFGFFKPVILLPVALVNNLSIQETESLILHELTHIKNNDYLWNWVLIVIEALYFFNPFIHIIGNNIRFEREKNCDTQVIQFNYTAIGYAETLLKAAILKSNAAGFQLPATGKNSELLKRIAFFTAKKNHHFNRRRYMGIASLLCLLVLSFNVLLFNSTMKNIPQEVATKTVVLQQPIYPANLIVENAAPEINSAPRIETAATHQQELMIEAYSFKKIILKPAIAKVSGNTWQTIPANSLAIVPPVNDIVPVQFTEPITTNSKQVTVKEESSENGQSVTRLYELKYVNGEMKITLLWNISESRSAIDSNNITRDTTNYYPPVQ